MPFLRVPNARFFYSRIDKATQSLLKAIKQEIPQKCSESTMGGETQLNTVDNTKFVYFSRKYCLIIIYIYNTLL